MWIVEVNFAGYQFTHRVHDRHRATRRGRSILRLSPLSWRARRAGTA
ncbi:hypothetical protein H7J88_18395 [Mycolicibacterium flavescens]|nr:hypothetical protein [Mycolicibacterium flavescens]MCV7281606.1 hypothetical protein [Mycolicibacterium flavescens]